ncbi:MAG: two-component system, OmpR family, sensor kinase [Thermoleophilaceae bacterium]|nr:two-component system, OmpR family, sensor kinase [Thermoleophilaceae bacterium]
MHVHGLRLRIAALVTLVVLACLGVAFVAVYRETSSQLTHRAQQDLRQDMDALAHAVSRGPATTDAAARRVRAFLRNQPFHPTSHIVSVTLDHARTITNEPELLGLSRAEPGEGSGTQRAENQAARSFFSAPAGLSVRKLPDAGRFQVLVRTIQVGAAHTARLGVGEPTAATDRAEDSVLDAFLLAGALGVLAALLGGVMVASRVASPLRRMAGVASRVDSGELRQRMEIGGRRDEVGVLADSFDHMLDRLEGAFERQTAFVADASHELRTPLTVIRGQLEVLAGEAHPSPAEVQRVERLVRTEILRMERLVEDLLLLAQAGTEGFLRPGRIDLPQFLDDLVRGQAETAARDLRLTATPPIAISADPDRLAQALRNLVANAIAHTRSGGRIDVAVRIADGTVSFIVDDDGPGIPEDQRAAVFDRFHRLDAGRTREAGGAGLGLAIVWAIAEAHGGRAYAEASPLGGARMVIALPS